jgi:NDP-sugar pyrophosphorylase family protein
MAGEGQRFKDAGYIKPKPLIDVKGEPMLNRVIRNLAVKDIECNFTLITRKEHDIERHIIDKCHTHLPYGTHRVIELDVPTEGALCTVLRAEKYINNAHPLLIANCDQLVEMDISDFMSKAEYASIVTFNSTNPHHSYVRTNRSGFVTEAREKQVISDQAVAGLYYFRFGYDFVKYAKYTISKDIRYNGEFYITPLFNEMIAENLVVNTYDIDVKNKHMLGTPEELQIFLDKVDKGVVDLSKL